MQETNLIPNILYVFGGEKAQGAEIVIERLMSQNAAKVNMHLILSPGKFADDLLSSGKPYKISMLSDLKKLNRTSTGRLQYFVKGMVNYVTVSFRVNRYILANNINMVHANTMVPASYLLPLIIYYRVLGMPVKWYWSDHDLKYFSKLDIKLSNMCARFYDRTLVVSEAVKRKYKGISDKVIVLYNGLDTACFKPEIALRNVFRNKWKLPENVIVLGIAASINPDKGHLELIQVFNKISLKYPSIKLMLAGDFASHFPDYKIQIEQAMTGNKNIIYAGFMNNMAEFYNGCDIIVNNSNDYRSESLGTTIYEAMACEKIVVASNTGGTPEIILDHTDGFLFEADNTDHLYNKLSYAVENYTSLDHVRQAARRKVEEKFNILTMLKNYNAIIVN